LHEAANRVTDVLHLVAQAERLGMPENRAAELRRKLTAPEARREIVDRIGRAIRRWLSARPPVGHPQLGRNPKTDPCRPSDPGL
jgi:hypothetical protein